MVILTLFLGFEVDIYSLYQALTYVLFVPVKLEDQFYSDKMFEIQRRSLLKGLYKKNTCEHNSNYYTQTTERRKGWNIVKHQFYQWIIHGKLKILTLSKEKLMFQHNFSP